MQQFGLNGPLWSLSYEFWYYILFPCGLLVFYAKKKRARIFYASLFVLIACFVGKQIMLYFLIWLIGAVIAIAKPLKIRKQSVKYLVLTISFLIAIVSMKFLYMFFPTGFNWKNPHFIPDLSVGIAFGIFIYLIVTLLKQNYRHNGKSLWNKLAGFSYTIYLAHYPLWYFYYAMVNSEVWKYDARTTFYFKCVFVLLIVAYSYVLSRFTEEKTGLLTYKVLSWYRGKVDAKTKR